MKNIIFQSNILGTNMNELNKIKSIIKEFEDKSIPEKCLIYENTKKELEFYSKLNNTIITENKKAYEQYLNSKVEYDSKYKKCISLEDKNENMKYQYNFLKQSDLKKEVLLKEIKERIGQIPNIKEIIEKQKLIIKEKEKEINDLKIALETKNKEYEKVEKERNKEFDNMNKIEKEMNIKICKHKNESSKIRNDIREIEKNIMNQIETFRKLNPKKIEEFQELYYSKNDDKKSLVDFLKKEQQIILKSIQDYKKEWHKNFKKEGNISYNQIAKNKNKFSDTKNNKKINESNNNNSNNNSKEKELIWLRDILMYTKDKS